MSKHTPGPWGRHGKTVFYEGHGARIVAECGQSTNPETDEANARLITAAPELLEAAKLLQTLMTEHQNDFKIQAKDLAIDLLASTMIQKFREAIMKAEGA